MIKIGVGHFLQISIMLVDLIILGFATYAFGILGFIVVLIIAISNKDLHLCAWNKKNIRRTFNHHWPNPSPQEYLETVLENLWKKK